MLIVSERGAAWSADLSTAESNASRAAPSARQEDFEPAEEDSPSSGDSKAPAVGAGVVVIGARDCRDCRGGIAPGGLARNGVP